MWVTGGTDYRRFDSCRQESWDAAFFSKDSDREAFLASLTAATTRLGQDMAKGVIKE
jgi:ADP-heptose:LPS heptosyltransferase